MTITAPRLFSVPMTLRTVTGHIVDLAGRSEPVFTDEQVMGAYRLRVTFDGFHDGAVATDEIIAYCKERLAGYKYPRLVEFRDALPKGPTGKILKRELRG